ncbi:hypothetical protein [Kribbella deserti]
MTDISDLMRRATDGLSPESPDLVQRGMAQGLRMRRRRTALVSAAAAGAVVLTAGFAVAVQSLGPADGQGVQVAVQTPTAKPTAPAPTKTTSATPKPPSRFALNTLRKLLPSGMKASDPNVWGEPGQFSGGSWTVDDGKGLAEVNAMVERHNVRKCSSEFPGACKRLADGTLVVSRPLELVYTDERNEGVLSNSVEVYRRDGVKVNMIAFNSEDEKGSPKTRAYPPFTVEQLTTMARNPAWKPAGRLFALPAKGSS